jgi:hypothetical protein
LKQKIGGAAFWPLTLPCTLWLLDKGKCGSHQLAGFHFRIETI